MIDEKELSFLQTAVERYHSFFEHSSDAIFVLTLSGKIVDVNQSAYEMYGFSREAPLSISIGDISSGQPPYSQIDAEDWIKKAIDEGSQRFPWRSKRMDGTVFWSEVCLKLFTIANEKQVVAEVRDTTDNKQLTQELERNRYLLSEAQRIAHFGSWIVVIGEEKVTWTKEMYRIFGVTPETFDSNTASFLNLIHPDDLSSMKQWMKSTFSGTKTPGFTFRIVRPDGSVRYILGNGDPIRDTEGKIVEVIGTAQDITEQRLAEENRAEETLFLTAREWQTTFDSIPDLVFVQDIHRKIVRVNQAFAQAFQTTPDQLIGQNCCEVFHGKQIPHDECQYADSLRLKQPRTTVMFEKRLDAWFETTINPILNNSGVVIGSVHIAHDITKLKKKEIELRESEQKYRHLFEDIPEPIYISSLDGTLIDCNQAAVDLFGYTREEAIGKNMIILYEQKEMREKIMETISQTGFVRDREVTFLDKNGVHHYCLITASVQKDNNGKMIGIEGIVKDVSNRKKAAKALQESSQILNAVLNTIPVRVFWKDKNLFYLGCNAPFAKDAGFEKPEDIIGKDDYAMGWKEQAELYRKDDQEVIDSGYAKPLYEETQTSSTGETITLLSSKLPLRDANQTIVGLLGTYYDITERKQDAEALIESEVKYRRLFEAAKDGILILDAETGMIVDVNPYLIDLLGFSLEQFLGKEVWELGFFHDIIANKDKFLELQKNRYVRYDNLPLKTADGRAISIEFVSNVYQVNHHSVIQCNIRNITERKIVEAERAKLEVQLHQAQKMESVGQLAGGVAHDFNNMLGVILGHTELAMEQIDPAMPIHANLMEIRTAAQRSADLTRQLLAFARKQNITPKVVDINKTIDGMLKLLRRLIGEDIELIWKPGDNLWPILIDPSQIDQILANLCVNARDAISVDGMIVIETGNLSVNEEYSADNFGFKPGKYVQINVSDNGKGMDKETLEHIFDPFFTTKDVGKGTGLGLSTVYGAVKQNNGFINAYSEPGLGTTLKIYLPQYVGKLAKVQVDVVEEPLVRGTETIMLVEDEQAILALTKVMLGSLGYTVLDAGSPAEALRIANVSKSEIHLLVTDVIMPGMNGKNLSEKLSLRYPGLKTIFLSGYTADIIAQHGVLEKGTNFIQKPFSRRELITKVREVLDSRVELAVSINGR